MHRDNNARLEHVRYVERLSVIDGIIAPDGNEQHIDMSDFCRKLVVYRVSYIAAVHYAHIVDIKYINHICAALLAADIVMIRWYSDYADALDAVLACIGDYNGRTRHSFNVVVVIVRMAACNGVRRYVVQLVPRSRSARIGQYSYPV